MALHRDPEAELEGGVLHSNGALDSITGNLTNHGTVDFTGGLHTLSVSGNYTQNSSGTLDIR